MIRWRTLLPPEHGVWGFLACGIAAALLAAPSWPGVIVALMLALSVCVRHGLRRGLVLHNRDLLLAALTVGVLCCGLGLLALFLSSTWWWVPLVLATPFAIGQIICEQVRREQQLPRSITESIVGITALAAGGGAVALAGGATPLVALQIAGIVSTYGACTVPYMRARLGRENHQVSLETHALGVVVAGSAYAAGANWCVAAIMLALSLRAFIALYRRRPKPVVAGLEELMVGLVIATCAGIGLHT